MPVSPALVAALTAALDTLFNHLAGAEAVATGRATDPGIGIRPD